jgi:methionyl-tRNA formyltransferase
VAIGADTTAAELRAELVDIGTELVLDALSSGLGTPAPQVGEPVYAHKLEAGELAIDWSAPAVQIHRLVRVGGAWTTFRGSRLKIWRTELPPGGNGLTIPTGSNPIELVEVQPEGRARMTASAWGNGVHWQLHDRLGT